MKKQLPGILLLTILMSLLLFWRLPDWFQHGNERVVEAWGDGYKAYHAILYHAQYDSTYSHYGGMNYPYGEHVIPGASQPLLSSVMKGMKSIGLAPLDYGFGLIHGSMLLGLMLCGVFLFLWLRRLSLPVWISTLAAIALTFMSPQLARFTSHYGLAHPELLPILLYLLQGFDKKPKWTIALVIGVVTGLYSAIHFYYFAILALTIFGFMVLRWWWLKDWKQTAHYVGYGSLMLLLPLAFFSIWLWCTDTVADRTDAPWGFFAFRAYPEGVFTSLLQPHWQWLDAHIIAIRKVDFEGQAYVGLLAGIYFFFVLGRWVSSRFRFPLIWAKEAHERYLNLIFLTSLVLLIFSFGVPFVFPGGKALVEYAGPIRQFRSIGRFAWVFYYVANACALYELYQYTRRRGYLPRVVTLLALGVLLLESYHYQKRIDLGLETIEETQDGQRFTDLPQIDYTTYQAILPVPYFNIGSDNYWWEGSGFSQQKTFTLSLQTGLPTLGAMLTRSSRQQSIQQLQLVTEPYRYPTIVDDFPNAKPLLMVWDSVRIQREWPGRYDHLLASAKLIHKAGELRLYELPLSAFQKNLDNRIDQLYTIIRQDSLHPSSEVYYQLHYNDRSSKLSYQGAGAFSASAKKGGTLLDTVWTYAEQDSVVLSVWMFFDADRYGRSELVFEEIDVSTGKVMQHQQQAAHRLLSVVDSNGWVLLEWPIVLQAAQSRLRCRVSNPPLGDAILYFDELLVRPKGANVYAKTPHGLVWNNRFYKP